MRAKEKSSWVLVDADLKPALQNLPDYEVSNENLAIIRERRASGAPSIDSLASDHIVRKEFHAPGPTGAPDVRVILTRPKIDEPLPLLVFIHAGGYVFGTAEGTGNNDVFLANKANCAVASVDYRLAPETVAPGQVEDCYTALMWLRNQSQTLGLDPERLAIGGISAGGGLAANLALMVRDRGELKLRLQMLFCPILDDQTVIRELPAHLGEFVWTPSTNAFGWQSLTGGVAGGDSIPPYASASRAGDLEGLAPAFLDVGALDLLAPETISYASRLIEAAVPVELHVHPGAYHGYELLPAVALAERARRLRGEALARAFK